MKTESINRWLTLGANLGVLLGVILLLSELKQNSHIVRATLGAEANSYYQQILISQTDSNLSEAMAVAIFRPEDLSEIQLVALDAHMNNLFGFLYRERYLTRMDIFKDDPRDLIVPLTADIMTNQFSQAWWTTHKIEFPADMVAIVDDAMKNLSSNKEKEDFDQIRTIIQETSR